MNDQPANTTADILAEVRRHNQERIEKLGRIGAQIDPQTLVMFRLEVLLELLDELGVIEMDEFNLRFENDLAPGLDDALLAAQQAARGLVLPS